MYGCWCVGCSIIPGGTSYPGVQILEEQLYIEKKRNQKKNDDCIPQRDLGVGRQY